MTLLTAIFHTIRTPLAVVVGRGDDIRFNRANKAFSNLVGCSEAELAGLPPSRLFSAWNNNNLLTSISSETVLLDRLKPDEPQRLLLTWEAVKDTEEPAYLLTAEDITAKTWIDTMSSSKKVMFSGILNDRYVIERYYQHDSAPLYGRLFRIEQESLHEFFNNHDRERLFYALEQAALHNRMDRIVVQTKLAANTAQLELHITFRPFYSGDGVLKHFGFIVTDVQTISEAIDPSVTLKVLMARSYMSAQQLSIETGISLQTISKLRNGKIGKPQRQTAMLIASKLNVTPQDIWP
ncbi:DNA-binding transcriptional regulator, XRE family [Paenibacillus sp. BC26]|nr:DNA-binding transcriptional regulator, XRE family [Paenibacillus sp. BC26]